MNQAKLQLIILDALLAFEQDQAQRTKRLAAIITQAIIDEQERLNPQKDTER